MAHHKKTAYQSAVNCFSFIGTELFEGIPLILDQSWPINSRLMPPHIMIGGQYIARARESGCHWSNGKVFSASVGKNDRNFPTLTTYVEDGKRLLFVQSSMSGLKEEIANLNIWVGTSTTSTAFIVKRSSNEALVEFKNDGDFVDIFYQDGSVRRVALKNGQLKSLQLSSEEMANIRVADAINQLEDCSCDNIKRRDAIFFGMINLLQLTKRDKGARDIVTDFLLEQNLTDSMKLKVRVSLDFLDDNRGAEFSDFNGNVISLTERKQFVGGGKKKHAKAN